LNELPRTVRLQLAVSLKQNCAQLGISALKELVKTCHLVRLERTVTKNVWKRRKIAPRAIPAKPAQVFIRQNHSMKMRAELVITALKVLTPQHQALKTVTVALVGCAPLATIALQARPML